MSAATFQQQTSPRRATAPLVIMGRGAAMEALCWWRGSTRRPTWRLGGTTPSHSRFAVASASLPVAVAGHSLWDLVRVRSRCRSCNVDSLWWRPPKDAITGLAGVHSPARRRVAPTQLNRLVFQGASTPVAHDTSPAEPSPGRLQPTAVEQPATRPRSCLRVQRRNQMSPTARIAATLPPGYTVRPPEPSDAEALFDMLAAYNTALVGVAATSTCGSPTRCCSSTTATTCSAPRNAPTEER
jgi:hypothetical protein